MTACPPENCKREREGVVNRVRLIGCGYGGGERMVIPQCYGVYTLPVGCNVDLAHHIKQECFLYARVLNTDYNIHHIKQECFLYVRVLNTDYNIHHMSCQHHNIAIM